MRRAGIILGKELRSYFDAPIAYIFIIIFLLLAGTYFAGNLFLQNISSLRTFFEAGPFLFLFFAPAITMRLISEEKRIGTFEIIQTKPIRTWEIVIGKFFAAWLLVCAALLPTLVYVMIVMSLGSVDPGALIGGYLGLLLLGGTFVAMGIFGSTLSDNQIVAVIISFLLVFVFFIFDKILMYLPAEVVPVVEYLSVGYHFSSLARGVVDSRDVLYYISLILFFLVLATIYTDREMGQSFWRLSQLRPGQQLPKIAMVFVGLVFLNLLSVGVFARVDLTRNKIYTLSTTTEDLLSRLDDNFVVRAYFTPELPPPYHNHRRSVQELLDEYRAFSRGKFHYQFVNPLSGPDVEYEALQAGVTPVQVKVIKSDKFQTKKVYVGFAFTYGDRNEKLPVVSSLERLEYDITSSMKRLGTDEVKRVGFLIGQGEPGPEKMQAVWEALSKQYRVLPVSLSESVITPADLAALIVVAPQHAFSEHEKFLLDQYIMGGGRVAFLINGVVPDAHARGVRPWNTNLDDMFDTYGWILNKDLVVDARCVRLTFTEESGGVSYSSERPMPFFPVASDFNVTNLVVKNLAPVAFSYVSSVDTRLAAIRGGTADVIVSSSTKSKRLQGGGLGIDPGKILDEDLFDEHHIPLGATVQGTFSSAFGSQRGASMLGMIRAGRDTIGVMERSSPTRMVIIGDGDFVLDDYLYGYDNTSFVINLVDWLVDDISLATIRSRDVVPKPLNEVSEETKTFTKYLAIAGPPGVVVGAGVARMLIRAGRRARHKRSF